MAVRGPYQNHRTWTPTSPSTCLICQAAYLATGSRQRVCGITCRKKLRAIQARVRRGSGELLPVDFVARKQNPVVRKLRTIEGRCLHKRLSFSLTDQWWHSQWAAQQGRCALTGFPMQFSGEKRNPWTVSVDRIDQTQGYHPDNCRLVCYRANEIRGAMNDAEFRVWLEALLHGLNWREGK